MDTIELVEGRDIHNVIEVIKKRAVESAVKAGADRSMLTCLAHENMMLISGIRYGHNCGSKQPAGSGQSRIYLVPHNSL